MSHSALKFGTRAVMMLHTLLLFPVLVSAFLYEHKHVPEKFVDQVRLAYVEPVIPTTVLYPETPDLIVDAYKRFVADEICPDFAEEIIANARRGVKSTQLTLVFTEVRALSVDPFYDNIDFHHGESTVKRLVTRFKVPEKTKTEWFALSSNYKDDIADVVVEALEETLVGMTCRNTNKHGVYKLWNAYIWCTFE